MIKRKVFFAIFIYFLVLGVAPGIALGNHIPGHPEPPPADPEFFGGAIPQGPQSGRGALDLLINITNWIFVIVLLFSVIFIVLAGWQFITGGGDAAAVSQARSKLLWGVVGIMVAVAARGIPVVVRAIIGG